MAKYVATRRALATGVHGFTPSRFLHRLGLIAPAAAWQPPALVPAPQPEAPPAVAASKPALNVPVQADVQPVSPSEPGLAPLPEPLVTAPVVVSPAAQVAVNVAVTEPSEAAAPAAPAPTLARAATPVVVAPVRVRPFAPPAVAPSHGVPARQVARTVTPSAAPLPPLPGTPMAIPPSRALLPPIEAATGADAAASIERAPDAPSSEKGFELARETAEPTADVAGALTDLEPRDVARPGVREIESAAPMAAAVATRQEPSAPPQHLARAQIVAPPPLVERASARADAPQPIERTADEPPVRNAPAPAALEAQAVDVPQAEPTSDAAHRLTDTPSEREEASAPPLRRRARVQEMPFDSAQGKPPHYVRTRPSAERTPSPRRPQGARTPQGPYGATPGDDARAAAPTPAADLAFGPSDGSDRSPLAWAARLADSLRDPSAPKPVMPSPAPAATAATSEPAVAPAPAPGPAPEPLPRAATRAAAPAAPVTAPPSRPGVPLTVIEPRSGQPVGALPVRAVPVSPQARSFLQPLVGIDPAEASFVQGPAADAVTSARRADAVAIGGVVALGREFAGDTSPEGLGLLAHELTHVARRVAPRFVPPIARAGSARRSTPTQASASVAHQTALEPAAHDVAVADEEATALRVEGRVRAAAAAQTQLIAPPAVPASLTTGAMTEAVVEPGEPIATGAPRPAKWGGLPAPWEPMPFDSAQDKPFDFAEDRPFATTGVARGAAVAVPAAFDGSAEAAAMHAAEDDRQLEAVPAGAAPSTSPEKSEPKPPDLDRLARQVYSVLKRRLQADAAREYAR